MIDITYVGLAAKKTKPENQDVVTIRFLDPLSHAVAFEAVKNHANTVAESVIKNGFMREVGNTTVYTPAHQIREVVVTRQS